MRKLFKRLVVKLYKWYGEPELLDITRYRNGFSESLCLNDNGDVDIFQIPEEERREFCEWVHTTYSHRYFNLILNTLLKAQEEEIIQNISQQSLLNNARAARHGVSIVGEQYEMISNKYIALTTQKEEVYDVHEVI